MKYFLKAILCLILIGSSIDLFSQEEEWNLNFEEWDLDNTTPDLWHDTTIIENRSGLFPPQWHYRPDHISEGTGLGRTTDATKGEYAVTLSGWYQYEVMRIISGSDSIRPGWAIDYKPHKLIGDYKAILLGDCDSLRTYVDVYLTSFDQLKNKRDTIGQANTVLKEAPSYQQFELEIEYSDQLIIPDTVIVILAKRRFGFDGPPDCLECSHVFFDNLNLISTVSVHDPNFLINEVKVFPNPADENISIESGCQDCQYNIYFISSTGQMVRKYNSITSGIKINTNNLERGIYFMKIENVTSGTKIYKKIILE